MKKKIKIQLIIIALLGIIATMFLISAVYYGLYKKQVQGDLRVDAELLKSTGVFDEDISTFYVDECDLRITLIDADGKVIYDNDADENIMDNHIDRPEVKSAFENGTGEAVRKSDTFSKNAFYYAIKLDNGMVLRVSREAGSVLSIFENSIPAVIAVIIVMVAVCIILAHVMTVMIIRPIEEIHVDGENLSIVPVYKELEPLVNTIRKQHENILQAAKMRQDFTANVSHELKTPLTAISGYAELIENGLVDKAETKKFSRKIVDNSNRLLALINDIIRLSELDSMESAVTFENVNLKQIVEKCVETLQINADKNNVRLIVDTNPIEVHANREMLIELVNNLCDNAIRYNVKNGTVILSVYEENKRAVLCVSDYGIGIPKEHQDRVFERFYRVDKSRSKQTGGTGLGLAIVKHIAAIHDAEIELESAKGVGTTIKIKF